MPAKRASDVCSAKRASDVLDSTHICMCSARFFSTESHVDRHSGRLTEHSFAQALSAESDADGRTADDVGSIQQDVEVSAVAQSTCKRGGLAPAGRLLQLHGPVRGSVAGRPRVVSAYPALRHSGPGITRGTSLIRNRAPLGPYSRTMPRAAWWS